MCDLALMSVEKSLEKIARRTSTEHKNEQPNKLLIKECKDALSKATKEAEDYMSEVKELKKVLTQHKSNLEESTKSIAGCKSILRESNSCLKSMITTYFIFIDFYKQIQDLGTKAECSSCN